MKWNMVSSLMYQNSIFNINKTEGVWVYSIPKERLTSSLKYHSLEDLKYFLSISTVHQMTKNGIKYLVFTDSLGFINKKVIG